MMPVGQAMICTSCSAAIPDEALFCSACGHAVSSVSQAPTGLASPSVAAAAARRSPSSSSRSAVWPPPTRSTGAGFTPGRFWRSGIGLSAFSAEAEWARSIAPMT